MKEITPSSSGSSGSVDAATGFKTRPSSLRLPPEEHVGSVPHHRQEQPNNCLSLENNSRTRMSVVNGDSSRITRVPPSHCQAGCRARTKCSACMELCSALLLITLRLQCCRSDIHIERIANTRKTVMKPGDDAMQLVLHVARKQQK